MLVAEKKNFWYLILVVYEVTKTLDVITAWNFLSLFYL